MEAPFVSVLSSGSCGNSFLVVRDGSAVLVDAGLSARELERRMSLFGVEPSQIDAVMLTHEHTDHVRGARRFCLDHGITAYGTRGTLSLTPLQGVNTAQLIARRTMHVGGLVIMPFTVMHMAAEPVAFRITAGRSSVAIASDLGCVTRDAVEHMKGASLLLVEANYDDAMLMSGVYPDFLKRAIRGKHGHLSNTDAGLLSSMAATADTDAIILVHLSRENNTPELARASVEESIRTGEKRARLTVPEHGAPSGPHRLA